jgi:hypothetical protein
MFARKHEPFMSSVSICMQDAFKLITVAEQSGTVRSRQGVGAVVDYGFEDCPPLDVLLVPGMPLPNHTPLTTCTSHYSLTVENFRTPFSSGSWCPEEMLTWKRSRSELFKLVCGASHENH